ncbi:MAG: VacJ family lipoprotein [Pseudomonadota bacterium]
MIEQTRVLARKAASLKHIVIASAALALLTGCSTVHHNNSALLMDKGQTKSAEATVEKKQDTESFALRSILRHESSFAQEAEIIEDDGTEMGEVGVDAEVRDPLEGLNRVFNGVNRGIDLALIRPISKVYGAVVPSPIRMMVGNIFRNFEAPGDVVNYTLQGNGAEAGKSLKRLVINSTLGIGGLFDVADHLGTPYNPTDFGLTLNDWGVGEGIYVVTPLLGPSTTRDSVGRIVDIALYPTTYIGVITDFDFGGTISRGVEIVDKRQRNGPLLDNVIFASPDPYVTLRSTYIQRRRSLASDNILGAEGMDDNLPVIVTSGS